MIFMSGVKVFLMKSMVAPDTHWVKCQVKKLHLIPNACNIRWEEFIINYYET